MLIAGRTADRIGPRKVVIAWFPLTAVFVYLMGVKMSVGVLYAVVFFAGLLLCSGQTMVYATVVTHHSDEDRPTALGWVSGICRFGAIFGPWIGGALLEAGSADIGFTVYACAALFGALMMTAAASPSKRARPLKFDRRQTNRVRSAHRHQLAAKYGSGGPVLPLRPVAAEDSVRSSRRASSESWSGEPRPPGRHRPG
ncbi:MFS transporter [Streptomyces flaveolus]|uniref:MFS transporter n=1 Tax=Streptomyces flaveolus TaxID=67297 RepID=UPI0037003C97